MFWTKKNHVNTISPGVQAALYSSFSKFELEQLARLATLVEVPAGTKLTIEGTAGMQAVVIVDGTASIQRGGETIATVGPGEIVGEMALISGEPRLATAVTDSAMTLYALSAPEFASLLAACPRLDSKVARMAVRRMAAAV